MPLLDYVICDVFTTRQFGGNQLAVFPNARGLSDKAMQSIARELNFSETTFVFESGDPLTPRVRIFTPAEEVPFAGHPNVGTAFVLANAGVFGPVGEGIEVCFEEHAGRVPVNIRRDSKQRLHCELEAPQGLEVGRSVSVAEVAAALSISQSDIRTEVHPPCEAGVGLPFLIVELASLEALGQVRANLDAFERLRARNVVPDVHMYVRSEDEFDLRARMFAPFYGVMEDAATGSANCALVALLTQMDPAFSSGGCWRIAQGVEMGRPSVLEARTAKSGERIRTWIGGHCAHVASGQLHLA